MIAFSMLVCLHGRKISFGVTRRAQRSDQVQRSDIVSVAGRELLRREKWRRAAVGDTKAGQKDGVLALRDKVRQYVSWCSVVHGWIFLRLGCRAGLGQNKFLFCAGSGSGCGFDGQRQLRGCAQRPLGCVTRALRERLRGCCAAACA